MIPSSEADLIGVRATGFVRCECKSLSRPFGSMQWRPTLENACKFC